MHKITNSDGEIIGKWCQVDTQDPRQWSGPMYLLQAVSSNGLTQGNIYIDRRPSDYSDDDLNLLIYSLKIIR